MPATSALEPGKLGLPPRSPRTSRISLLRSPRRLHTLEPQPPPRRNRARMRPAALDTGPRPASRAKPSPSPPEQGLAGETVPHTNGSPSAEPPRKAETARERPAEGKGGSGVMGQNARKPPPPPPEPGGPEAGPVPHNPLNVSESGAGIPLRCGRPGTCRPDVPGLPERWRPPRPALSTGRSRTPPGSSAYNSAISRPHWRARAQLRDCRQPRALPPGEPLGGYDGPRITSPSRLLTSACTVSDLPSATAPRFCPKCAAKAWAQRYTAAYGPAVPLGTGIQTVATAHSPQTVMTALRATASHAASGYWAASWASAEKGTQSQPFPSVCASMPVKATSRGLSGSLSTWIHVGASSMR